MLILIEWLHVRIIDGEKLFKGSLFVSEPDNQWVNNPKAEGIQVNQVGIS